MAVRPRPELDNSEGLKASNLEVHLGLDAHGGQWQARTVSKAAKKVLDALEELSEPERREVYAEVLRRAALAEHPALEDEGLVAAGDEDFLELDRATSQE